MDKYQHQKDKEVEEAFDIIGETLEGVESNVNDVFYEKKPIIKVAKPEAESEDKKNEPNQKRLEKAEIALNILKGVVESKDSIKESLALFNEIRKVDLEIAKVYSGIQISREKIKSYNNALCLKSETIKKVIELYREKINFIMKIIESINVDSDEMFERKIQLIDRSNQLLDKLSNILLKYLTL